MRSSTSRMVSIMKVLVRNLMNCWRVSSAVVIDPLNKDLLNDTATCVLLADECVRMCENFWVKCLIALANVCDNIDR